MTMDKLKLTGQNLVRVFNFRFERVLTPCTSFIAAQTVQLRVENLTQTILRLSPVSFCALLFKLFCTYFKSAEFHYYQIISIF
jgi:hypothetical protein